jgi:hypothetical protein
MAGRAKYSQQSKDAALGALMSSASQGQDGAWLPQYRSVSAALRISEKTLRRWWRAREVVDDAALRRSSTRARSEVRAEGAKSWIEDRVEDLRQGVEWVLSPDRRAEVDRPDQMARALKDIAAVVREVQALTGTDDVTDPAARMRELRAAAAQVGLTQDGEA